MVRLKRWQWIVLALPVIGVVGFLGIAASLEIHQRHLNWIWAIFLIVFLGWRWLLVKWLRPPVLEEVETVLAELEAETQRLPPVADKMGDQQTQQAQAAIQTILHSAREDQPPWEDWSLFFNRCQALIGAIAQVYHPQVKRPLLNIYIPQAYGLIRDTVDDVDRWMQKLSPALSQVTVGQAYEAYELYQKLEPATRTALKIWNWSMWVLNPAAAMARTATRRYSSNANQQLLVNLGQILREETLSALGGRAIALYSGKPITLDLAVPEDLGHTQTLREILTQTDNPQTLAQKPLNLLLVGRTGAGKSSLINTLFKGEKAEVDILPQTDRLQDYRLQAATGDELMLWDAPGYEQIGGRELREQVLEQAAVSDVLLLVTPATDPALQMDLEFLEATKAETGDLPAIAVVTQVDRLRPIREWHPPYDWQQGQRPKEQAIQEAIHYRQELLGNQCSAVLPLVTEETRKQRHPWGVEALSIALVEMIDPAKQSRLARFLRNLETRSVTAAKIIDHYTFQLSTTQGLAALLKSPVLNFISTMITGSPALAVLLAEKIPVEQSPVVLGKLQMAYELFSLLAQPGSGQKFDLLTLWPLLLDNSVSPAQDAWALGQTLVGFWSGSLKAEQLRDQYNHYLQPDMNLAQTAD